MNDSSNVKRTAAVSDEPVRAGLPVWAVVLAAAAIAAIGMGLRQVMGLYLVPVSTELGTGREVFALSVAITNIVWGIAAPFTGAFSDRFGTGKVVVFGAFSTLLGLVTLSWASTQAHVLLAGMFLGFGVAGTGVNAVVGAVSRSVSDKERTAGIAAVGIGSGVGILVALPYAHVLIQSLDWRMSLLVLAATTVFLLPLAHLVRGSSEGDDGSAEAIARRQTLEAALSEAMRHPSFWLLNAGFFVCGFHVVFYATHLPGYVETQGFAPWVGVWGLVAVGAGNLLGTYLAGQWGRRWQQRHGLVLIYAGRALIFLAFLFAPITEWTVIALSGLLGLLWLSTIPLTSGLVATFFGPRWMTMLYGIVFFSHQAGSFLGVWLAGVLYDRMQSYDAMWWISVGLALFAVAVHWPIDERPVARLREQAA